MTNHYRGTVIAFLVVLFATSLVGSAHAQGGNPGIIPPQEKFHGLSYADWQVKWEQELLTIPFSLDHPFVTGQPFGTDKGIQFLIGTTGGVSFDVTIPAGTALFFPVIVTECSNLEPWPFYGATAADQAACAKYFNDNVSGVAAEIDGKSVQNTAQYRVQTPQYPFIVPDGNILGVPGPAEGTSVSEGFFLLLAPMSVGVHTIHFTGTYDLQALFGPGAFYIVDTNYVVTVTPR